MPGVPLDALDQLKKGIKGIFSKKKPKKEETPTTTSEPSSSATTKPSETTPAASAPAPAPATAPEPAKAPTTAPETTSSTPAQPAAAPAPAEPRSNEAAALAEIKKATQSRYTSPSAPVVQPKQDDDELWNGSRRRQKFAEDDDCDAPKVIEAKATDTPTESSAPAAPLDLPAIPTSKPAAGMSATSGPMFDEPDFDSNTKEEKPIAPSTTPAAPSATEPSATEPSATAPSATQPAPTEK
ncbi:hypothetical protein N0V83_000776 [Neocucurbitaria cava]|uniref:Uncharacterized protein n=1 Tax=Neocucurbitaria cava TaxID=798079 RepID=A0A9W9CRI1_9PLEO|nr:hypothetical protein N0V83_000776 [Neocucurbitaria cava]